MGVTSSRLSKTRELSSIAPGPMVSGFLWHSSKWVNHFALGIIQYIPGPKMLACIIHISLNCCKIYSEGIFKPDKMFLLIKLCVLNKQKIGKIGKLRVSLKVCIYLFIYFCKCVWEEGWMMGFFCLNLTRALYWTYWGLTVPTDTQRHLICFYSLGVKKTSTFFNLYPHLFPTTYGFRFIHNKVKILRF